MFVVVFKRTGEQIRYYLKDEIGFITCIYKCRAQPRLKVKSYFIFVGIHGKYTLFCFVKDSSTLNQILPIRETETFSKIFIHKTLLSSKHKSQAQNLFVS